MVLKKLFKLSKSKDSGKSNNSTENRELKIDTKQEYTKQPSSSPPNSYSSPSPVNDNVNSNTTSFSSTNSSLSNSTIYNNFLNLSNNPRISKELVPIITLLNCQSSRIYNQGPLYLNVEYSNPNIVEQDLSYSLVDGVIKGNQFILYKQGLETQFKPLTIDLLEATVNLQPDENSFIITSSNKVAFHLKFTDARFLQSWIAAIKLSNFEYHKLNEAYTASLLSAKGPSLSDLHVVLAESRYASEEWCSIKFGKQGKWVSCYCVITPFEKSRKGNKNGSIQFYTSNKTSKKNLICSILDIETCYAVYPHVDLIDESTLIRLNGDVIVYNVDETFDGISRSNSTLNSPVVRSRSNSVISSSNINIGNHKRTESSSSIASLNKNSNVKGLLISNTSLYILPKPHNGVKSFETLIRYLIPVYDSFQLYGRPKKLNADKVDPKSLLFGLPSLPHVELLTDEHSYQLVHDNWDTIAQLESPSKVDSDDDSFNYNELFTSQIQYLYSKDVRHQGFGDIKTTLIREAQFENPLIKFNSYSIPDFESTSASPTTPKFSFNSSDLPANVDPKKITNIIRSSSNYQLNQVVNASSPPLPAPTINISRLRSNSNSNSNSLSGRFSGPSSRSVSNTNLNSYIRSASNSRTASINASPSVLAAQAAFQKEETQPIGA